jgi:hypothetical protein
MKDWIKKQWNKAKKWWLAVLLALGFAVIPAGAGTISFTWTNATQNEDGTVFDPATEQMEVRIYCNGDTTPTFVSPGASAALDVITTPGTYTCVARTVNMEGTESADSNEATKVVLRSAPLPPVLQ